MTLLCLLLTFDPAVSPQLLTPGGTPTALLDGLLADTPYSVEVVPLYADGVGPGITADGKTREAPPPRREVIGHVTCDVSCESFSFA